jgi:hypothetical protein
VTVDPRERELLAQFLGVAVLRLDVDRTLEEECFVEAVHLGGVGIFRSLATPNCEWSNEA